MNLPNKNNILLALIILAAFLIRFFIIGEVPPGVSHDELEYINNGYSIIKTGRDLYKDFLPLTVGGVSYVAIPAYIAGLPTIFFGLREWSVRLPPVIFGTVEVLLIYLIAKNLFIKEKIALFSALILTFSTWGITISRMMLDSSVSLFFFMFGIYLFISSKTKKRFIFACVSLSLGMLSYYGSIFISPFVFAILFWYRWGYFKINKNTLFFSGTIFLIALIVLFNMLFNPGQNSRSFGRSSELIFFQNIRIEDNVIYSRSLSEAPDWYSKIFLNKATYIFKAFFINYFGAFSPKMIFVQGDPDRSYGLWDRGEISLFLSPFLLLGFVITFSKFKKQNLLIGAFLLIAPITSGMTTPVYATRSFLLWPFLILICAMGLWWFFEWIKKKKPIFYRFSIMIFTLFYILTILGFIHQYFFQYPVYAKEIWFDSEKQLAQYLIVHKSEKITIYSLEGRQAFMEYFFFAKLDPRIAQDAVTKTDIKADINIGNFRFVNGCFDPDKSHYDHKIIINTSCVPLNFDKASESILTRDKSDTVKWAIFNPQKPI